MSSLTFKLLSLQTKMTQVLNLITTATCLAVTTHLIKEGLTPWSAKLEWLWDLLGNIIIAYLVILNLMRLALLLTRIKRLVLIHGVIRSTKLLYVFATESFLTAINPGQRKCCPCNNLDLEALQSLPADTKITNSPHIKQNQRTPSTLGESRPDNTEDQEEITQADIKIKGKNDWQLQETRSRTEHPFHSQIAKASRPLPNSVKTKEDTEEIKDQTDPESKMGKEMTELYKAQAKTHRDASRPTTDN